MDALEILRIQIIKKAIKQALKTSIKLKKGCGIHVIEPSFKLLKSRIEEGYNFIAYSLDSVILRSAIDLAKNVMKKFIVKTMKEEGSKAKKVFDKYIKLAIKDTKIFFNESKLNHLVCISCGKKGRELFNKHNFQYHICDNCFSIYVCPRPNQKL